VTCAAELMNANTCDASDVFGMNNAIGTFNKVLCTANL